MDHQDRLEVLGTTMEAASFDGFRALLLLVETHVGKLRSDRHHQFRGALLVADKDPLLHPNIDDLECKGWRCLRWCSLQVDNGVAHFEAHRDHL